MQKTVDPGGYKENKQRTTLCISVFQYIVVNAFRKPIALKNLSKMLKGIKWESAPHGWMNSEFFSRHLKTLNRKLMVKNDHGGNIFG